MHQAAADRGLVVTRCLEVVPREGKPPLMHIYVLRWPQAARTSGNSELVEEFVVRLADGRLSQDMLAARDMIGMPPVKLG